MSVSMQIDIVSSDGEIFSGKAEMLYAQAADGEVGVLPNHSPFLSSLIPGAVRVVNGDEENHFYINSGIIEVQANIVTILAETAIRAADLDQAEAEMAKQRAQAAMVDAQTETDIARAQIELAEAVGQIQAITKLRNRLRQKGLA